MLDGIYNDLQDMEDFPEDYSPGDRQRAVENLTALQQLSTDIRNG